MTERTSPHATSACLPEQPSVPSCDKGHGEKEWSECWSCGGAGYHDDLHEVDPLWYDEDDTETCDICRGDGGWWRCYTCAPATEDDL